MSVGKWQGCHGGHQTPVGALTPADGYSEPEPVRRTPPTKEQIALVRDFCNGSIVIFAPLLTATLRIVLDDYERLRTEETARRV